MSSVQPPPYESTSQPLSRNQQEATVVVQSDPAASVPSRGNWKGMRITGYLQGILGAVSVLLGLIAIVFKAFMYFVAFPIWAGVCFFIVTGILGIAAGKKQKQALVVVYLTLSIITAVVAGGMVIAHGIAVALDGSFCPDFHYERYYGTCSTSFAVRGTINGMIAILGLVEMVVAIVGASMTCSRLCCAPRPTHVVAYHSPHQFILAGQPQGFVQYSVVPQQQYIQQPPMGHVMYPGQSVMLPPSQSQYAPQPQGQVPYMPPPQGQGQACPPPEKPPVGV